MANDNQTLILKTDNALKVNKVSKALSLTEKLLATIPLKKINYVIQLGLFDSAIAVYKDGEPVIIRFIDTQMETTPSCVSFNKNWYWFEKYAEVEIKKSA